MEEKIKIIKKQAGGDIELLRESLLQKRILMEVEVKDIFGKGTSEATIPLSIFTKDMGVLETVVKYLKDEAQLSFSEIASYLKRDYKTIWASYSQARRKVKEREARR